MPCGPPIFLLNGYRRLFLTG